MNLFSYKAADASGKVIRGVLEAPGKKEAVEKIHGMGYIPIRIDLSKGAGKKLDWKFLDRFTSVFNTVSAGDVMLFTQDLSVLLNAGLPVDRALAILIEVTGKDRFKEIIGEILKAVQGGAYLSDALSRYPKVFSTFYVNMIRAGETGGVLGPVLERLGLFLEGAQDLRDFVRSAMVYPMFLVAVGGLSIIVLMTYVVPKFSVIFADMGDAIPFTTRLLLGFSNFLRSWWWALFLVIVLLYVLLVRYLRTPKGRQFFDQLKLRLPVSGDLVRKIEVARFSRTLGTLTRSGVPILQALTLVRDIIGNQVISRALGKVNNRVKEGDRLSKALNDLNLFPSLAVQMITVGEETGRLDAMLLRVAENYEKVVRTTVRRFISFLEPAMILFMGVIVGVIVISMLMAIFSMNELPF
ncbi:MAG TPA: type II secretion system F family protein [Syntrophales bacterium]|nr:type II secretion system F family protein [Syntrophales bacterium]HPX12367.1 type II secretion system F family protein [Syntrophales bacterium]HQB31358.1 type II secretion system F family protein [Syntrophales bacterium]HQN77917.1 type II secretion system F family protein [Syntrophales bacterium]HQQ28249.1 type II secretion system F family protein [Syntrophales bacterium]